jgi:hypothetical protein
MSLGRVVESRRETDGWADEIVTLRDHGGDVQWLMLSVHELACA